jgi:hypothetical protein
MVRYSLHFEYLMAASLQRDVMVIELYWAKVCVCVSLVGESVITPSRMQSLS